jgi:hypothetical protein
MVEWLKWLSTWLARGEGPFNTSTTKTKTKTNRQNWLRATGPEAFCKPVANTPGLHLTAVASSSYLGQIFLTILTMWAHYTFKPLPSPPLPYSCFLFLWQSQYVVLAGLQFTILLLHPPVCWNYWHVPLYLACCLFLKQRRQKPSLGHAFGPASLWGRLPDRYLGPKVS